MAQDVLRRSPLDAAHRALGARMTPFAGWEMPIQYAGIVEEVRAVRERAGLFDVSHMGRLFLNGPDALTLLRETLTYDAANVEEGAGHYNLLCDEHGGILDDPYLYRIGRERWLLVGNASRYDADLRWLHGHRRSAMDLALDDRQAATVMLALQGPGARHVFQAVFSAELERAVPRHACREIELFRQKALVSRTGYTGEDGFEFVCGLDAGRSLWEALVAAGVTPCGLGARDVLRLEAALPLYGNDIDTTTTPWEAGLGWVVSLDAERPFEGRQALQNTRGATDRRLSCIRATERAVPRHGYTVRHEGRELGALTSGSFSPTINAGIGMAYLPLDLAKPGTALEVEIRGRAVPAAVVKRPFYRAANRE
ncbi:MAG TPA: glycine cleavage system aminomethyltransferase GcvT [Dehalococcoidia bacterium]|nr:glycine cleavage system aminomethyltransferase GcvT [Dehalococcoidia bacterium]